MNPYISIDEIVFSNKEKLKLNDNDIVIFVGPNNVGKSYSLEKIYNFLGEKKSGGLLIDDIKINIYSDKKQIKNFIFENSARKPTYGYITYCGYQYEIEDYKLKNIDIKDWENNGLSKYRGVFSNFLSTKSRLELSNAPNSINLISDGAKHPIHILQKNDDIEKIISTYFKSVFNLDLIVHRNAGQIVPLYVGERPNCTDRDRTSISYIEELEKLQRLSIQGDGMQSFASILLNVFVANHSIIFIDEPEAFLHPPQMRTLGKIIGNDLPGKKQLFLATHSQDFIKGLIDSNNKNIKIIRVDRNGDENYFKILNNDYIQDLWSNSFTRYSNVLNSLFHSKVFVCESDSDVQFYSAICDVVYEKEGRISPDFQFIQSGGKDRIPSIIEKLKLVNNNITIIVDFDVLKTDTILKIYESVNGDKTVELKKHHKILNSSLNNKKDKKIKDLKKEIDSLLNPLDDKSEITTQVRNTIRDLLKRESHWDIVKKSGQHSIPNGDSTVSLNILFDILEEKNIYIVRDGEIESFAKSIPDHGPKWLNSVLKKNLKEDPELEEARNFIYKICYFE